MSISSIGAVIHVNQQTASVSSIVSNQNNKFDLQNISNQTSIQEKDEKVLKVRPTEKNAKINKDKEESKKEFNKEQNNNITNQYKLDILV